MPCATVLGKEGKERSAEVHSSMYDNLRINLPRELMGFEDFPFNTDFIGSEDPRRFCTHHEVARRRLAARLVTL